MPAAPHADSVSTSTSTSRSTSTSTTTTTSVSAVHLADGRIVSAGATCAVVVAAGSWTPLLLRPLGLLVPLYPLKGYSVLADLSQAAVRHAEAESEEAGKMEETICRRKAKSEKESKAKESEAEDNMDETVDSRPRRGGSRGASATAPQRILIEPEDNLFVSRHGPQLRVAAFGEFAGWDTRPDPHLAAQLRRVSAALWPEYSEELERGRVVCGLRPFVADGALLLGGDSTYR